MERGKRTFITEAEAKAYELSDFISFHSYSKYEKFLTGIYTLKKYFRRPIIVTEWLNRCNHNTVQEIYPLMLIENVGCYCWGFVQGKTYTTEPWEALWKQAESNPDVDFDFTKWQHELYRKNLHPYDPREINTIRHCNALADKK